MEDVAVAFKELVGSMMRGKWEKKKSGYGET